MTALGIGQSTAVGIGGDPVKGTGFVDVLQAFEQDEQTLAVLMIGEIGGVGEEQAALYARDHMTKPVAAFIAGRCAPPGRRMGHAGAIISGGQGGAQDKIDAIRACGIPVADTPDLLGNVLLEAVQKKGVDLSLLR